MQTVYKMSMYNILCPAKAEEAYCIFIYDSSENVSELEGKQPIIFRSKEQLSNYLSSPAGIGHLQGWLDRGGSVAIRKILLIDNEI